MLLANNSCYFYSIAAACSAKIAVAAPEVAAAHLPQELLFLFPYQEAASFTAIFFAPNICLAK